MVGIYQIKSDGSIIEIIKPSKKDPQLLWRYLQSKTKQESKFYISQQDFQSILNKQIAIKYEGQIQI